MPSLNFNLQSVGISRTSYHVYTQSSPLSPFLTLPPFHVARAPFLVKAINNNRTPAGLLPSTPLETSFYRTSVPGPINASRITIIDSLLISHAVRLETWELLRLFLRKSRKTEERGNDQRVR